MQIRPIYGKEYDALSMLHLNSQAQQYNGFTPGQRVLGERLKYRLARSVILFCDFANPQDTPAAPTNRVRAKQRGAEILSGKRFTREAQRIVKSSGSGHEEAKNSLSGTLCISIRKATQIHRIPNGNDAASLYGDLGEKAICCIIAGAR